MISPMRRAVIALLMLVGSGAAVLPIHATELQQPRVITGAYHTTNPLYPLLGAETGIMLYDVTGLVRDDYNYTPPVESQVLGTIDGDIVSGEYRIELPETPQGVSLDFDGDSSSPPAVQVFATATYINFLGDFYINRGETALDMSALVDPLSYDIVGGHLVVWTPREGEAFPGGAGPDHAPFTPDDPLLSLPAGWSVVALDGASYSLIRDETVDIPIIESFGGLHDYAELSYLDAWNALFTRVQESYPFTAEKELDWAALYDFITPLVEAAQNDLEFHIVIAQFGSLIPDTHIGYGSLQVMQAYLLGGIGVGLPAVTDGGEVVVTTVAPDSPAAEAGIQVGDVLVSVNGEPVLKALDETPLLLSSASTGHVRRYLQTATLLQGPVGSQVVLTWRKPDGAQQTANLTRVVDITSLLRAFGLGGDGAEDVITARMMESGLGYISVRGFAEEVSRADEWFARELQGLIDAGARGIIIDVRNNSGGLVQLAMSMAGRFFPDYKRLLDFYYADGQGGFAYRGFVEILASAPYYDGPVAVLVDVMTGSAGDLFAYAMQTDHRALIVGHTPTGGFTGEVGDGQYNLPGGLQIQVPTGRPVDPVTGATLIEGRGILPDIRVPLTREALLSSEDEVLLAAESALLAG